MPEPGPTPAARQRSAAVLLTAAALSLALSFVPYGRTVTYPFRLFVTVVHESSHALASLLTGGSVEGMRVAPDGSGVALTRGGNSLMVASAGYTGTALFGATLLLACPRRAGARRVLQLLGAGTLLATVLLVAFSPIPFILTLVLAAALLVVGAGGRWASPWRWPAAAFAGIATIVLLAMLTSQGALFTWLTGIALSAALFLAGNLLKPAPAHFLLAFLALQCCLAAVSDLLTLIAVSVDGHRNSDAAILQDLTGVPALFWALAWSALALVALGVALRSFLRSTVEP